MKNILYSGLSLALSLTILSACSSTESAEATSKDKKKKFSPTHEFGTVSSQKVGQQIQLPGEFLPFQQVSIYPKADGFVEKVLVDRGSKVHKGQVLMVLEAPETEEQLVAARSNYLKAKAMLVGSAEHYRRLLAGSRISGSVSALDLESAHAKMMADSAAAMGEQANFGALAKIKSYLVVRAPFDGVITERNVHPGALVGSGMKLAGPMLMLQQQNRLRLVVDIPETYSLGVENGKEVTFEVNAMPGKKFTGKISRRSGNMNEKFRSETVEIDVKNNDQLIRPGMFAEISMASDGTAGAMSVPSSAILTSTERQYVVRLQNGLAEYVEIKPGQQSDTMTEVFGNLHVGDRIITNPRNDLKNGTKIAMK
ncbi:efflux RND transporter periplasmic adaptor subunit [Dyadobacter psychrotolerans]|nr:efflux RND transporter periplasmic adaptor subunit [Dyadobacter psychrotolerans]